MLDNDLKEALNGIIKAELSPVKFLRNLKASTYVIKWYVDLRLNGIILRLDRSRTRTIPNQTSRAGNQRIVKRMELIQDQQHRIIELFRHVRLNKRLN